MPRPVAINVLTGGIEKIHEGPDFAVNLGTDEHDMAVALATAWLCASGDPILMGEHTVVDLSIKAANVAHLAYQTIGEELEKILLDQEIEEAADDFMSQQLKDL